jgi:hypothetical protein
MLEFRSVDFLRIDCLLTNGTSQLVLVNKLAIVNGARNCFVLLDELEPQLL